MRVDCPNLKRFQGSLRAVSTETKKTEPQIVNSALKDVCFRAMQFTDKTPPGQIQAELYRDNLLVKLAAKRVAGKYGSGRVDRYGNTRLRGRGKTRNVRKSEIIREANKILKRRVASGGAIRAGWIPAARRVGASVRGDRLSSRGSAARGTGQKATISSVFGFIRNALITRSGATGRRVPVANIPDAVEGLRKAVAFVASDREAYVRRKQLARAARRALK